MRKNLFSNKITPISWSYFVKIYVWIQRCFRCKVFTNERMVDLVGLEPTTLGLRGLCSNQLSYRSKISRMKWLRRCESNTRPPGYEPGELPLLYSAENEWCQWADLNRRPQGYESCALTSWATLARLKLGDVTIGQWAHYIEKSELSNNFQEEKTSYNIYEVLLITFQS